MNKYTHRKENDKEIFKAHKKIITARRAVVCFLF